MANLIPLAIADLELQLASAISVGATSFTLSSANDDDGNAIPAGQYCFTLDSGTSNKEYLIGQVNGVNVTSVKSVSRQGVETTGAARAHRVGAPCILTDFATIQRVADILRGQLALDGANPIVYDAEPTLADRKELATVGYVLDTVTGGTVTFDQQVITGNAGESIVAGDLVYFKTSDQEWYKTDADTAATVEGVQLGIALGTGSDGVSITGGIQIAGSYTTTGLTAGALYYASNTAGAIATSAGTTSRVIGLALSTIKLLIIPRNSRSLTDSQEAALLGDTTPSSVNRFLTKGKSVTAGAAINGGTLPVPVYQNKTDNEFYSCDANDTNALKFVGFAISNGTDGGAMNVQFSGVVSGFTGLQEGEKYYVQDTAGTIGTTIGTYEVLVGIAISETELLIQKGRRARNGNGTFIDGGAALTTQTSVITTGFRPNLIKLTAVQGWGTAQSRISIGSWNNGTYASVRLEIDGSSDASTSASYIALTENDSGSAGWRFTITSVSDTAFTISAQQIETSPDPVYYTWEAEGEL